MAEALHQAKRHKAFENSRFIGLALDGTGAGRTYKEPCPLCDPIKDAKGEVHGSLHHFVLISVVGTGLTLPIDVEPYGLLEAAGEGTKMADHFSPIFRPAFPSSAILSERSSPSRVRFAAPNNGAPLTAPGRSGQHS